MFFCINFIFVSELIAVLSVWCLDTIKVLRSDEGRELRARHQENVRYLRGKLLEVGLPVIHTPSHIIPVHVCMIRSHSFYSCCIVRAFSYNREGEWVFTLFLLISFSSCKISVVHIVSVV